MTYFFAPTAKDAAEINETEAGWYFCLPLDEAWFGPYGTKGEASTDYQVLMHEIGGDSGT